MIKIEMFENVLAKDSLEVVIGERQRAIQIDRQLYVAIFPTVYIDPFVADYSARTAAQVEKASCFRRSTLLAAERITQSNGDEMEVPPQKCQRPMTQEEEKKLPQFSQPAAASPASSSHDPLLPCRTIH